MSVTPDQTVRKSDAPDRNGPIRKSASPYIIDLLEDGLEAQVAIRHPNGKVLVVALKAQRNTVTAYAPPSATWREEDGEVAVSWWTAEE